MTPPEVLQQGKRRRTFAIISHPDAGKTTLTEKLLLYAGMVRTAGMVRGRKNQKAVSSDWMAMEQERGISITASAMQFEYKGAVINVLDTPGHQDFSEDTYRTLTAADSAVMVIDAAKGVEPQTRKLFKVCKMRGIPILTFVNKMDLPARETLDLLSELEEILGLQTSPLNWPVGSGKEFIGVIDRSSNEFVRFEENDSSRGSQKVVQRRESLKDATIPSPLREEVLEELALLDEAGNPFSEEKFLSGEITPVFFGSALTNFGVEPFFDAFTNLAPAPNARKVYLPDGTEKFLDPYHEEFSGYVFKIQANMDPRHRDSMAYIRVCSGKFERDHPVNHVRSGKKVRLSRSHSMFGGERTTLDAAYPGDIIGVVNPGLFSIGDTVTTSEQYTFQSMPKFPPEVIAEIQPKDVLRKKSFDKAMTQFHAEGAVLILRGIDKYTTNPLVAAVGPLQFEVLQSRLQAEYKVDSNLTILPFRHGAWIRGDKSAFQTTSSSILCSDEDENLIVLYTQEWERNFLAEKNPQHSLLEFV